MPHKTYAEMTGPQGFDNCSREQQQQLLNWLMARLGPDQRGAIMRDLPTAYNAWCGQDVVDVVNVKTGERIEAVRS